MGFALGRAALADGTGTSPEDMQRLIGATFMNSGIIPGPLVGDVSGTSAMSYRVDAGAAVIYANSAAKLAYLVPFEATTIVTDPAPSTGSRTDTVYVDSSGSVRVAMGSSAPSSAVSLGQFVVPAGATSTQSVANTLDRRYAIPTGASLGRLAHWDFPAKTWTGATGTDIIRYSKRFTVPTDRLVRVELSVSTKSVDSSTGWSAIGVEIDGDFRRALHATYGPDEETQSGNWTAELAAGAHELTVFTVKFRGSDFKTMPYASASEVNVWDAGVSL